MAISKFSELVFECLNDFDKRLLYYDILYLSNKDQRKFKIYRKIFKVFLSYNYDPFLKEIKKNKIICSYPYSRQDHRKLFDEITKKIKCFKIYSYRKKFYFNVKVILNVIYDCKKLIVSKKITFKEKLFLIFNLIFYKNSLSSIKNITPDENKKFLFFSSCVGPEMILSIWANEIKKITTYSLTHGQTYIKFKQFDPIDIVNAKNINADYVLVWGNQQKRDLIKNYSYCSKKIIISGNPLFRKILSYKNKNKLGFVLLPRHVYEKNNLELLKLLSKVNYQFIILPHPSLSKENLNKEHNNLKFDFKNHYRDIIKNYRPSFAITYNSSVYFEIMSFGIPCYRYKKYENDIYKGLKDEFCNINELKYLIGNNENFTKNNFVNFKKLLVDNLGLGIDNYKKVLNE